MEMKRTWIGLLAALPFSAIAHHGWSEYDTTRALTLTGTVAESGWEHPHGFVKLETPGKTWIVVLAPPSRMENRGLQKAAIASGMTATVESPAASKTLMSVSTAVVTAGATVGHATAVQEAALLGEILATKTSMLPPLGPRRSFVSPGKTAEPVCPIA